MFVSLSVDVASWHRASFTCVSMLHILFTDGMIVCCACLMFMLSRALRKADQA